MIKKEMVADSNNLQMIEHEYPPLGRVLFLGFG